MAGIIEPNEPDHVVGHVEPNEQEPHEPDHVVTTNDMLHVGLLVARFQPAQIQRHSYASNYQFFRDHLGASPRVCCTIYEDLQLTDIVDAKLTGNQTNLIWFLKGLYFLRKYPKESSIASILGLSIRWGRDPLWSIVKRIQAMKAVKIVWPEDFGTDI